MALGVIFAGSKRCKGDELHKTELPVYEKSSFLCVGK